MNAQLKKEILIVKHIGDQIGYGNLMSLASALWKLNIGVDLADGAFVPTIASFVKDEYREMTEQESKNYVALVKKALGSDL